METYDILDETSADENLLSVYARKKARQAGLWMIISAAAGLVLFGGLLLLFMVDNGQVNETEEIVLALFFMCMVFKYALLLISAIQTRMGSVSSRSHLLYKAVFNLRIVWIFVGVLALVFLVQAILYYATGFEMFGEITRDLLRLR